jgi:hypothetical protein
MLIGVDASPIATNLPNRMGSLSAIFRQQIQLGPATPNCGFSHANRW